LKRSKLDVMLAMGSYASVGPVVAARMAGIPIVLHEANVVPGRAISFLARGAERTGITFPSAARHFPEGKTVLTGLPLFHTPRPGMPRKETGTGPFSILVMGGSQGAQHLNTVMPAVFSKLQEKDYRIKVIHLAGDRDNQTVDAQYREAGVSAEVMAFASNMPDLYLGADIAICRSGAATCMELAVFGLPAVLVPYPHASRDHQLHNARALEAVGAARIFEQPDLTVDAVREYIANCMDHPEVLAAMREALSGLAVPGADEKLANLVEQPDMTSNV
jgi:UDP-N-acetylglucosamine--N-acetylmuramyl-(pentapeptide) pyrophosphoryl-undecaprenol N-acetylglucosamine transferase